MPQSFSNTLIHIVFSTKNRVNFIDEEIEPKLFGYIGQICNHQNCKTIIVGGYKDHVHILCNLHRTISQSNLVREIKASSSKWMKFQGEKFKNFFWQDGYGVFSVSQSESGRVTKYIQNQKQHHQIKNFKEEYLELLSLNDISFDERYIWD